MYDSSPDARSSVSTIRKLGRDPRAVASTRPADTAGTSTPIATPTTTRTPNATRVEVLITGYQRATLAACNSTPSSDECAHSIGFVVLRPARPATSSAPRTSWVWVHNAAARPGGTTSLPRTPPYTP